MVENTQGEFERDARERLAAAYDRFAGMLYRHALLITADPGMAEDAVQQAFAKLAGMGVRIKELAAIEHYLRKAVRNECYRLLKSDRAVSDGDESRALLVPVDAAMECDEQRRAIEAALRKLPAEQREMVHLKVYEGLTFVQIGELLEIPMNTAASRYRYALEKLRELLGCLQWKEE